MRLRKLNWTTGALAVLALWAKPGVYLAAGVTARVSVESAAGGTRAKDNANVVVWLTPFGPDAGPRESAREGIPRPRLIQKNKTFDPHVLAVRVGSQVDFPNHDPFFHNVFSLFNGKRFDLGLYEAGSTRGVRFDRVGICYIFCNIHPQMSAVVVVVDTPYFTVSDSQGKASIPQVPPGHYQIHLWDEHCDSGALARMSRQVTVGEEAMALGDIHLVESNQSPVTHNNKYGKPYDPEVFPAPIYVNP